MFRGLATLNLYADDVEEAAAWYADVLGIEPYYAFPRPPEKPAYLEFRIGDDGDELGIIDRRWAPPAATAGPGGAIMHWHVDDLDDVLARLLDRGAVVYEPTTPREAGFVTASVVDPFGNVLGVMTNPHWLEMLAARTSA